MIEWVPWPSLARWAEAAPRGDSGQEAARAQDTDRASRRVNEGDIRGFGHVEGNPGESGEQGERRWGNRQI